MIDVEQIGRGASNSLTPTSLCTMTKHLSAVAILFFSVTVILVNATRAPAGVSLVTSRAALAGTDTLDWTNAAPDFTPIRNPRFNSSLFRERDPIRRLSKMRLPSSNCGALATWLVGVHWGNRRFHFIRNAPRAL
jgi:hypothetical protein